MRFFLEAFKEFIASHKVAIGVTRMDLGAGPSLEEYHKELRQMKLNPPLFEIDARRPQDVTMLLEALMYSLDPWLGEA